MKTQKYSSPIWYKVSEALREKEIADHINLINAMNYFKFKELYFNIPTITIPDHFYL
jgi:hypothetical protein